MDDDAADSAEGSPVSWNFNSSYSDKDVLEEIKYYVQSDDNESNKFYDDVVQHIESKIGRQLVCLEKTWSERQYVNVVMKMWLRKSCRKAFYYLDNKTTDISLEMSSLLTGLDSIHSFEDIRSKLADESRVRYWCDGGCQYLKLILDQKDLLETAHRFVVPVINYLKQFKSSCTDKVFSRCLNDIAKDKVRGDKFVKFISSLDEFLAHLREDKELQDLLEEENTVGISGRDLVKKLIGNVSKIKLTLPEWVIRFISINTQLPDEEWTPKLQSLTLETCKKFLLPRNEIKIKDDDGRQIIFIKGIVIFVSKIIKQMLELKRANPNVQEVQIVGLTSVHVDWHLESKDWHGINVGVVSDQIFVNGEVCWDVSGLHGYIKPGTSTMCSMNDKGANYPKPGESGGNVYVVCNEMTAINNGRWTITSDGGDGDNASKDANRKWTKEKFEMVFPSMSRFDSAGENAVSKVLAKLEEILPPENRDHGVDIGKGHDDAFFVGGTAKDGNRITAAYFYKINKTTRNIKNKCTVVLRLKLLNFFSYLYQLSGAVGQGGFGGTIVIENLSGDMGKKSSVLFTGKDKRQITYVRTNFYEAFGSDGNMSKLVGDVGFIHNESSSLCKQNNKGEFFGFDSDVRLHLKFQTKKPRGKGSNLYGRLHHPINGLNYASIVCSSNRESYEDHSLTFDQKRMVEAVKKKAVTLQSLGQHLAQIDERKQMTQSLQKMLANPLDQHCNIGVLMNNISNKEVQLNHQLTSQRQYHQEKIGQGHYVKPSSLKKEDVGRAACSYRVNADRRPVCFADCKKPPANKVYCLEALPTVGGVDSALHCIFGRPNSDGLYYCNNTNKYRHRLAKFILDKENRSKMSAPIESFVLRVKNGSKDFPVASIMKDSYTKHKKVEKKSNWQIPTDRFEKLLEEYAKFVECPSSFLLITELKLLALIHQLTIHVYESQSYSFQFKSTFNLNGGGCNMDPLNENFLLYEPDGECQRLKANTNLQPFCSQIENDLFKFQPFQTISFANLMEWSKENCCNDKIISSLKMLNPEDGETPDELSRLLLERLKEIAMKNGPINELESEIGILSERVEEYNSRNISPIFYLHIVAKSEPYEWKYDFLLLEIEEQLSSPLKPAERKVWRDNLFYSLDDRILSLLRERLVTSRTGISTSLLEPEKFERMLKLLESKTEEESGKLVEHLRQLPLNKWYDELKSKVGMKNDNSSSRKTSRNEENDKEEPAPNLSQERILSDIMSLINTDNDWPSTFLRDIENRVSASSLMAERDDKSIQKLIQKWQTKGLKLNDDESLIQFLYVYDYAVTKVYASLNKNGNNRNQPFRLRDTQKVTIITLLMSTSTLAQVSTGEGKSLIVAGVAIAHALSGKKIDVIISNDVLALRDSNRSVADGGLRDIYEYFKVKVANNCSHTEDDRGKAYDSAVVYGELANFQRDYLLDSFYGRNIRGDRTFDLVIIDEVDCMLLDRGNNTLYLSHDIPGMEMLESLYVFIWEKICNHNLGLEKIKCDVLYDLYGTITKKHLEAVHAPLKTNPSKLNELWNYLIEAKIIDPQGRLLADKLERIARINYIENPDLNLKLIFYFRNVIERERHIRIPSHLLSFVDRHLDTWLENALFAMYLKPEVDYVVDQDRTDKSTDLNPQVIVIDPHTGTDQTSSQWDGSLHQFLQLKEGCKLTLQSLKAVFISNTTYIKRYKMLLGTSGTLGFEAEQEFLKKKYDCKCIFIPTAFPKCFTIKPAKVLKTKQSWLEAIKEEVRITVSPTKEKRSAVIFCRSIRDVNIVHQYLTASFPKVKETRQIHRYIRDFEEFAFESKTLDVGHIIVATNLAGRGTDIKISRELNENGGLHVCLAYLPENERIEEQAMGRAGRNGAPGSGIIILCEPQFSKRELSVESHEEWSTERFINMKEERNTRERQRISRLEEDFCGIDLQEKFFNEFSNHHTQLKIDLKHLKWDDPIIKAVCDSILDKWALWLDEMEVDAAFLSFECINYFFRKELIGVLTLPENPSDIEWMTPARSVVVAKHLITNRENKPSFLTAACVILDRLIESNDSFFYPSAHYYRSLIYTTDNFQKNKKPFIRTLRTCESNLIKHIEMQSSCLDKITQTNNMRSDEKLPFCVVDSYKQQKQKVIQIFQYFICSTRSLLGSHSCSASDVQNALIAKNTKNEKASEKKLMKKANELFESLVKSKCIINQVNDEKTVPNRDAVIQRVAYDNGVGQSSLVESLENIRGKNESFNIERGVSFCRTISKDKIFGKKISSDGLGEREIEKKLKSIQMIRYSRKKFWEYLLDKGVLQECVIVSESEAAKMNRLDPEFTDGIFVQYSYSGSFKDLKKNGKVIFRREYKKANTCRNNKEIDYDYALLDLERLKSVDLTSFGQLKSHDLMYTNIDTDEWPHIWNDLLKQNIIDEKGNLVPNKETKFFRYPQCPAYEVPVRKLIETTFAVEIVRRQWLNAKKDPNSLKAIEILPLKPYRKILNDLKASHVICGAQVTEDTTLLEKTVNDICSSEDTRQCVLEFLKSRQAIYVTTKMTPDTFCLYSLESHIRTIKEMSGVLSELHAFTLVGFDHVINMKERAATWKFFGSASLVIFGGVAQIVARVVGQNFGLLTQEYGDAVSQQGMADINYGIKAIKYRQEITWDDYKRHKMDLIKSDLVMIKDTMLNSLEADDEFEFDSELMTSAPYSRGNERTIRDQSICQDMPATEDSSAMNHFQSVEHKVDLFFQLRVTFQSTLLEKTNSVIRKNSVEMKETLGNLYRSHGLEKAQKTVKTKMKELVDNSFDHSLGVAVKAWNKLLEKQFFQLDDAGTFKWENKEELRTNLVLKMGISVIKRTQMECINKFHAELRKSCSSESSTTNDFDDEERHRFLTNGIANIKSELARNVEKLTQKMMEYFIHNHNAFT